MAESEQLSKPSSSVISSSQFSSNIDEKNFELANESKQEDHLNDGELRELYELEKCIERIKKCEIDSPKVALQFSDVKLCNSARIAQIIEENVICKTYILADTSYGSCCVDEIAAEHVKADLIIHFGHSCLSRTERIPVLFIFGKEKIDIDCCSDSFKNCFPEEHSKIILIYDVLYHHAIGEIHSRLSREYKSLILASINCSNGFSYDKRQTSSEDTQEHTVKDNICKGNVLDPNQCCKAAELDGNLNNVSLQKESYSNTSYSRLGRTFCLPDGFSIEDYVIFYIGKESLTLTNHMMSYNKCQFYSYNPETSHCQKETLNVNRSLMKRYYLIERAKDAQVVGILIGTLGIANYLAILNRIKQMLRRCRKKYYTFVVGKINPEKLANFMEIDLFVLIACPENSLISSQDFYKPIITPYEMEIACLRAQEWTGDYVTDFKQLLPGGFHHVELEDKDNKEDKIPDVSLISGQLRSMYPQQENNDVKSDSLVSRNKNTTLSTQHHVSAAQFLGQRSWKGLEVKRGETAVVKAVEGRTGIASGYINEPGAREKIVLKTCRNDPPMDEKNQVTEKRRKQEGPNF